MPVHVPGTYEFLMLDMDFLQASTIMRVNCAFHVCPVSANPTVPGTYRTPNRHQAKRKQTPSYEQQTPSTKLLPTLYEYEESSYFRPIIILSSCISSYRCFSCIIKESTTKANVVQCGRAN
jgi:hypothetical protein